MHACAELIFRRTQLRARAPGSKLPFPFIGLYRFAPATGSLQAIPEAVLQLFIAKVHEVHY